MIFRKSSRGITNHCHRHGRLVKVVVVVQFDGVYAAFGQQNGCFGCFIEHRNCCWFQAGRYHQNCQSPVRWLLYFRLCGTRCLKTKNWVGGLQIDVHLAFRTEEPFSCSLEACDVVDVVVVVIIVVVSEEQVCFSYCLMVDLLV